MCIRDSYEAVWLGVEENDIETLKGLPEFERVGGYYMLGEELSEQGYHASYVSCDPQMMEIAKAQMNLLAVSYTHLDVYKRQEQGTACAVPCLQKDAFRQKIGACYHR